MGPTTTSTTTTEAGPTSISSNASVSSAGGDGGSTTSANGGGGSSSTDGGGGAVAEGGGGSTGEGGEGGILTGAGGGLTDQACTEGPKIGCVPFPTLPGTGGGGGAGGAGGAGGSPPPPDDDCDDDGDPNDTDCQPCNPDAFHGQDEYFPIPFEPFEDDASPSFDYDCDGVRAVEYPYEADGCSGVALASCDDATIFTGDDSPICGEDRFLQDCKQVGILLASCDEDGAGTNAEVRCH